MADCLATNLRVRLTSLVDTVGDMQRSSMELVTAHDDDDDDDDNFHVTLPHHRCIAMSGQSSNAAYQLSLYQL